MTATQLVMAQHDAIVLRSSHRHHEVLDLPLDLHSKLCDSSALVQAKQRPLGRQRPVRLRAWSEGAMTARIRRALPVCFDLSFQASTGRVGR
jgi:hypothetical protein